MGGQVLQEGADYAVVGQPGVNAGTYQLTVAGILGYGGAVEAAWSIGRAQGQVALESQSVTLSPDQAEGGQVAVEAVGDGAVSAQSQMCRRDRPGGGPGPAAGGGPAGQLRHHQPHRPAHRHPGRGGG